MFLLSFQDSLDLTQLQAHDNTVASIGILSRFDDPCVVLIDVVGVESSCFADGVERLAEFKVLIIFETFFDVECKGQIVKDIFVGGLVVFTHGFEQSFFVAYDEIVDKMVVDFHLGA